MNVFKSKPHIDIEETKKKLNRHERFKVQMQCDEYISLLESFDFENLGEGDRFKLHDMGIFNVEIADDEFTLRLRLSGGRVSTAQLRLIASIAKEHDLEIILTARAQMQLHGLTEENVIDVFKQVNAAGITTWQTFGDNIRNIVTDVYDGRGRYSEIEAYPYIQQMQNSVLKRSDLLGMLPRRVSVGISGTRANVSSFFANDLYFALAQKEGIKGFNVYLGGKNTEVAQDADIFLQPEEVVEFFESVVTAFNKHGLRYKRTRTRLFHLIEDIGMQSVKAFIQEEYFKAFTTAGELLLEKGTFSQFETLNDGTYAYCYHTDFARVDADELLKIALFAQEEGEEVRLGIDHHIYILGLKEKTVPFENIQETSTIVACAGSDYCPYSYWSIKEETKYLPLDKIAEHGITVGFSGCIKGCGRHHHADIGLVGIRSRAFGASEKAARVYVGGEHTFGKAPARRIFSTVPIEHLSALLCAIIEEYEQSGYNSFETFSHHVLNNYSGSFLALWFMAKVHTGSNALLPADPDNEIDETEGSEFEYDLMEEHFDGSDFLAVIDDTFSDAISLLGKKLWSAGEENPGLPQQLQQRLVVKKQWEL